MLLMVGCLDAVSASLAEVLSKKTRVIMVDKKAPSVQKYKNVTTYDISLHGDDYENLFRAFSFDTVLFFPPRDKKSVAQKRGDLADLSNVLEQCVKHNTNRMLYISSSEVYYGGKSEETAERTKKSMTSVLLEAGEEMCATYSREKGLLSRTIHVPMLFSNNAADLPIMDFVNAIHEDREAVIYGQELDVADFLHVNDLADFIIRYSDENYDIKSDAINLPGTGTLTYLDIANILRAKYEKASIIISDEPYPVHMKNETARQMYDWQAYIDIKEKLISLIDTLIASLPKNNNALIRGTKKLFTKKNILMLAELILGFLLMQWITSWSVTSTQLSFVDFRLLFIVILATVHGMRAGVLAALMSTVSYVIAYINTGLDWQILAYNISNWMPLVMYFMLGAIIGYSRDKISEQAEAAESEKDAVENKYAFLYELYNHSITTKEALKEQIMGYTDTYGRFYRAVQKLNSMLPDEVLLNAVECMEDFLNNKSIAVYGMDKNKAFARLSICSTPLNGTLPKSMRLEDHAEMMEEISQGNMFINRELKKDKPAYCIPVRNNSEIVALILIWNAQPEQFTTDYVNKIHILVGMTQISIVRALNYQDMTEDEAYIAGTHILRYEKFKETCRLRFSMQRKDMAKFSLIRIKNTDKSFEEIEKTVNTLIRQLDVMGVDSRNRLYVLLSQADKSNVQAIKERLRKKGIECE